MTLKQQTRQILERAADLFESGQCAFTTGRLWLPETDEIPDHPQAACMVGAIYLAAQSKVSPATAAARAAAVNAAHIWHGIEGGHAGFADLISINDEIIPLIRTGPGLAFETTEAVSARILRDAAQLTGQTGPEFPDTPQGADDLMKAIQRETLQILETHGPIIVHNGFNRDQEE